MAGDYELYKVTLDRVLSGSVNPLCLTFCVMKLSDDGTDFDCHMTDIEEIDSGGSTIHGAYSMECRLLAADTSFKASTQIWTLESPWVISDFGADENDEKGTVLRFERITLKTTADRPDNAMAKVVVQNSRASLATKNWKE